MAFLLDDTLKFPKDHFQSMKYQPYELKPSFSMKRVYQWWDAWDKDIYVSFSGGLDSTVLAYIVCSAYRKYGLNGKIPLVFSDTGMEFPEIRSFVYEYTDWLKEQFPELDIELEVIRPKHNFKWVCETYGFPMISKETALRIEKLRHGNLSEKYRNYLLNGDDRGRRYSLSKKWHYLADPAITKEDISEKCCKFLKKDPFKEYVKETGRQAFIGTTQDEGFIRENLYNHHGCNVYDAKTPKSTPLGFWPKQEVIQFVVDNHIPICSVYGKPAKNEKGEWHFTGEQRTGCVACSFGVNNESTPNRFQRLLTSENPSHRKLCEFCFRCTSNGVDYETALHHIGVRTDIPEKQETRQMTIEDFIDARNADW